MKKRILRLSLVYKSMWIKNLIMLLAACLISGVALTGCSGGGEEGEKEEQSSEKEED